MLEYKENYCLHLRLCVIINFAANMNDSSRCDVYIPVNESIYYQTSPGETVLFSTVFPVVTTIGLLINFSFFFVIYRVKEMQTVTNIYLGNLAVADVALLVMGGAQSIVTGINSPRFMINFSFRAAASCITVAVFGYGAYFASVFLVTIVMFERYMAICHPLKHRMIRGKRRAIRMIVVTWLVSLGMGSCNAFESDLKIYCVEWRDNSGTIQIDTIPQCTPYPIAEIMHRILILMDLGQFILAVIFGACMMSRIIYTLSNREVTVPDRTEKTTSINKARNQVARMLILNAVVFFFCLIPYEFYNIAVFIEYTTGSNVITNQTVLLIVRWGGLATTLLNSTINPILYNMTNSRYRNASKKAFMCSSSDAKKSKSKKNLTSTKCRYGYSRC